METTQRGAAITASGLSLRGSRGWVYRDVTFTAPAGGLVAVEGPAGSGRTCLLLTLAGRMRPTSGSGSVGGPPLPRHMAAVRRIAALGTVPGVNELDPSLTVAEHLHERALLHRRFGEGLVRALTHGRARRRADERLRTGQALEIAGLTLKDLPNGPRTPVRDLDALDTLRLGIALALLARPAMLCLDDADRGLASADRALAWRTLRTVADTGVTVVATCAEAPGEGVTVRLGPPSADKAEKGARQRTPGTEDGTEDSARKEAADACAQARRS